MISALWPRLVLLALGLGLAAACTEPDHTAKTKDTQPDYQPDVSLDLHALSQRREGGSGAELEKEAAEKRSRQSHRQVVASSDEEPGLLERERSAKSAGSPQPRNFDFRPQDQLSRSSSAGTEVPSDLERASYFRSGGGFDIRKAQAVVQRFSSRYGSCFAAAKDGPSPDGGRIDLRITVDVDGRATSIALDPASPVRDSGLATCLAAKLQGLSYPQAKGSAAVFVVPFQF